MLSRQIICISIGAIIGASLGAIISTKIQDQDVSASSYTIPTTPNNGTGTKNYMIACP